MILGRRRREEHGERLRFCVIYSKLVLDFIKSPSMKTVRLDDNLNVRVERAARMLGMSKSKFLRHALIRCCDEVLGESLALRLAPVVGIVKSSGGRAAHSGVVFKTTVTGRRRR